VLLESRQLSLLVVLKSLSFRRMQDTRDVFQRSFSKGLRYGATLELVYPLKLTWSKSTKELSVIFYARCDRDCIASSVCLHLVAAVERQVHHGEVMIQRAERAYLLSIYCTVALCVVLCYLNVFSKISQRISTLFALSSTPFITLQTPAITPVLPYMYNTPWVTQARPRVFQNCFGQVTDNTLELC
jgi:hypothetical protein